VHLSVCLTVQGDRSSWFSQALKEATLVPFSGYARSVDGPASALIEFHHLDMVICRGR
jgi:hypothetical protein